MKPASPEIPALADRYFAEQCRRLGPIDGVSMSVEQAPKPALSSARKPFEKRARRTLDSKLNPFQL